MDIEGLGTKLVEQLVDRGLVSSVADLYRLNEDSVAALDRMAAKSASNLVVAIAASRATTLQRLLFALGIRHVGEHLAGVLAGRFGSLEKIAAATPEELLAVHEVGPEVAESVSSFFGQEANRKIVEDLSAFGVRYESPAHPGSRELEGKSFAFTGSLVSLSREEARELVRSKGGKASSSVSGKTDYVVVGAKPGSKADKAARLGLTVISEQEFLILVKGR